jgi:hypothetical protein
LTTRPNPFAFLPELHADTVRNIVLLNSTDHLIMEASSLSDQRQKSEYSIRRSGRPFTKDYRIHFEREHDKVPVSPFHDIPLYHDRGKGILNMVVEVPRWTNAKFEVWTDWLTRHHSVEQPPFKYG